VFRLGNTRKEDEQIMRAMSSVVGARVVGSSSARVEVLRGARPARERVFPGRKKALVAAAALLALLAAFAALIAGPREDCLHPSESDDQ
jgi:uncharacterized protein involved in exopolysaccharide biosynthesis